MLGLLFHWMKFLVLKLNNSGNNKSFIAVLWVMLERTLPFLLLALFAELFSLNRKQKFSLRQTRVVR